MRRRDFNKRARMRRALLGGSAGRGGGRRHQPGRHGPDCRAAMAERVGQEFGGLGFVGFSGTFNHGPKRVVGVVCCPWPSLVRGDADEIWHSRGCVGSKHTNGEASGCGSYFSFGKWSAHVDPKEPVFEGKPEWGDWLLVVYPFYEIGD